MSRNAVRIVALASFAVLVLAGVSYAGHSWGSYHWARTSNPVTLKTGDNVHSKWDAYLDEAIVDWNSPTSGRSLMVRLSEVAGGTNPKNCRPTDGRIEVCAAKYGNNGWLGLAQIWTSGGHIVKATSKLNDTYFDTATYDTPAWRRLVMCQEIAHDFGLGHQDETFDNPNLGSCMDYTNDPDGGSGGASSNDPGNEHPNDHDFEQLEIIYSGHTDGSTSAQALASVSPAFASVPLDAVESWGELVWAAGSQSGEAAAIFMQDFGHGDRVFTHVLFADPEVVASLKKTPGPGAPGRPNQQ